VAKKLWGYEDWAHRPRDLFGRIRSNFCDANRLVPSWTVGVDFKACKVAKAVNNSNMLYPTTLKGYNSGLFRLSRLQKR